MTVTIAESVARRLHGAEALRVRLAAQAEYPGGVVEGVLVNTRGRYAAELITSGGHRLTIELGREGEFRGLSRPESQSRHF